MMTRSVLDLAKMTFEEQLIAMRKTTVLVGIHGLSIFGLINLFLPGSFSAKVDDFLPRAQHVHLRIFDHTDDHRLRWHGVCEPSCIFALESSWFWIQGKEFRVQRTNPIPQAPNP